MTATTEARHPASAYHERRRREVDERMMTAAREILAEVGLDRFTVEEVARRSGIAKTTIYRRHDDASQLAIAAAAAGHELLLDDMRGRMAAAVGVALADADGRGENIDALNGLDGKLLMQLALATPVQS